MTEQQAVERCDLLINGMSVNLATNRAFTDRCKGYPTFETMKEFAEISKYALEKQIPKKPIDKIMYLECPACGDVGILDCAYCSVCGQKLDWSDEE